MFPLRNAKKRYCGVLDEKKVIDNKQFCETVKPLISDMSLSRDKFVINGKKIVKSESETVESSCQI